MTQPVCRIITLEHRPQSQITLRALSDTLDRWGWHYEIFPAVDGRSVTEDTWREIGVSIHSSGKLASRPGAQGCFLSHYTLWSQCRASAQSMIILEDDCLAQGPWDPSIAASTDLVKLTQATGTKTNPQSGQWSLGSHAYWLTADHADQLITWSRHNGARAVDKQLGQTVVPWRFLGRDLFLLNPLRGNSTTSPRRLDK
jgi:hypothetical protein